MNRQYAFKDENTVFVSNEKGNLTEEKFTTNFDEIKIQENVIEELEKILKELDNQKNINRRYRLIYKVLKKIVRALILIISGILVVFSASLEIPFISIMVMVMVMILFCEGVVYTVAKENEEEYHFYELKTLCLEKYLEKENEKLSNLHKESKLCKEQETKTTFVEINDKEQLNNIKTYLEALKQYEKDITRQAKIYAKGKWELEEKEKIENNGLDADAFAEYLNEYNTNKLTRNKKVS